MRARCPWSKAGKMLGPRWRGTLPFRVLFCRLFALSLARRFADSLILPTGGTYAYRSGCFWF